MSARLRLIMRRVHLKHNPISLIEDGDVWRGWVHIVDMDGYDNPNITSEAKWAIQTKISGEQAAKRKALICDATVIVLGQIKESAGYITTDDNCHLYCSAISS